MKIIIESQINEEQLNNLISSMWDCGFVIDSKVFEIENDLFNSLKNQSWVKKLNKNLLLIHTDYGDIKLQKPTKY